MHPVVTVPNPKRIHAHHVNHWAIVWLLLFLFSMSCLTIVFGAETGQFLKLGIGARPVGTGYSLSTIIDDINALSYNPAGLVQMRNPQASFTHAQLHDDATRLDFLGYAHPLSISGLPQMTIGGAVTHLSQGAISGRDANRQPTGAITASDTSLQLGMGVKMTRSVGLGASVRYIESQLAAATARTMAFDFGGQWRQNRMELGAAVRNVGPGLRYHETTDALPLTASLGAGYHLPMGMMLSANFSQRVQTGKSEFSFGTEYAMMPMMTLRAGYLANLTSSGADSSSSNASNLGSLGAGMGLKIMGSQLDYSFTPMGALGSTQRISLTTGFKGAANNSSAVDHDNSDPIIKVLH